MQLKNLALLSILAILACAGRSATAAIIPMGLQSNVSQATLGSWGWTEIHRSNANTDVVGAEASIIASATGTHLMMGVWDKNLNVYSILGAGQTSVVTAITQTGSYTGPASLNNWSNGLNFYRTAPTAPSYGSWGFTTVDGVNQGAADTNLFNGINHPGETLNGTPTAAAGLSFHNRFGDLISGWAYNVTGNNMTGIGSNYERVFFTANAESEAVPEPASLVIWGGLGIAGLVAARRRKKVAAA